MMKKQSGFTLIEIVMVLVLLGILTAVAVPKYFDLQNEAAQKAAATFAAEYQARLNANFAKKLLAGNACSDAVTLAKKAVEGDTDLFNAAATATGDIITAAVQRSGEGKDTSVVDLTIKVKGNTFTNYTARLPACN